MIVADLESISDQHLFVLDFHYNILLGLTSGTDFEEALQCAKEADAEIQRRFGEDASENLTSVISGYRMSSEDMLNWALEHPKQCIEAARTGRVTAFEH